MHAALSVYGIPDMRDMLPDIPQEHVPAVSKVLVDRWTAMGPARQVSEATAFCTAVERGGLEVAKTHPWWPVLANLSVAPFEAEV
jgi:hypothetical protein